MSVPYKRIHVVINPASGKDEPILNTFNRVFGQYEVEWSISVTYKYGDAGEQAKAAIAEGVDLVAGYGGDGTQHEIANAVLRTAAETGRSIPMGILPGGTGNGFAREMHIPKTLKAAVELLCTSQNTRQIDVAQVEDQYFIQRLYVGVEPEEQTSREMKDKYGVFAYAVSMYERIKTRKEIDYHVTVDGQVKEFKAIKAYVVNSGMTGTGLSVTNKYAIDDGLLDAFMFNTHDFETLKGTSDRFFRLDTKAARKNYLQCRELTIETTPDQPVWSDGEYLGRTPVTVKVVPKALTIAVP
jgi:YegS/Rv2252/BmrU family lipid kinase